MRFLFVWTVKMDVGMVGGTQASLITLAHALVACGHQVAILSRDSRFGERGRIRIDRATPVEMLYSGAPDVALGGVVQWYKPDVLLGVAGIVPQVARDFAGRLPAVAAYVVDTYSSSPDFLIPDDPRVAYFACSRFMVDRLRALTGIESEILASPIDPALYRVAGPGDSVVFINPVPVKGVFIAVAMAKARPEIPFTFVAGWQTATPHQEMLERAIAGLGNIRRMPNQADMRVVYGAARILLTPTVSEEAFGRVAIEAQWSGIPVLSSDKGGLREAIGDGGLVLDAHAPIADWVAALDRMWTDAALYARLSAAARSNAAAAGCDPGEIAEFFLSRMTQRIAAAPTPAVPAR